MAACTSILDPRRRSSVFFGAATGGFARRQDDAGGGCGGAAAPRLPPRWRVPLRRSVSVGAALGAVAGATVGRAGRRTSSVGGGGADSAALRAASSARRSCSASAARRALFLGLRASLLPRAGALPRRRKGSRSFPLRAARPRAAPNHAAGRQAPAGARRVPSRSGAPGPGRRPASGSGVAWWRRSARRAG